MKAAIAEVQELLGESCLSVLAHSPGAVWVLNAAGEVLYFNHAATVPVELVGRRALDFLKPEHHVAYLRNLVRVIEDGETIEFDFNSIIGQVWAQRFVPLRDKDGKSRWAMCFGHQVESSTSFDGKGIMPSRHVGIALDTAGMGLWRWDARANAIHLDVRACVIHGLLPNSAAHIAMEEFLALIHVDDRASIREAWNDSSPGEFRELEYRRVFSDGSTRWISCSGTFLVGKGNVQSAALGSCFDITEDKYLSMQLMQSQKLEAVGQLTAGIAHNFNNILSAILPNLQMARRHVSADGEKFLRNANLAAERATDLVAELMVVAGRKEGQARQSLDLYEVCERVTRICRTTFGGWIQLNIEFEQECPLVLGNESQLEQVLLNLLLNARDAFEAASISCPHIDIELSSQSSPESGSQAVLRVIDNGPGMSESTLARVFEPFFTTKGAGTGLGLATAYAIISDHGGTISCWSKPDRGTRFDILLPAHEGEIVAPAPVLRSSFVGGQERILVVDDDNLVRRVTTEALREAGYEVIEASGGSQAIEVHRDMSIDLVVLDMVMPELTGDQVLQALRLEKPGTRVLIFSGFANFKAEKLDRVGLLQKPAGVNDLLQAVRREIDRDLIN